MPNQAIVSSSASGDAPARFAGFALPTSNTTYTPNQFFDVCLPYCSRGCVRLVSLMIRKTLGWCDEHGRPQQERIRLSYADFQAAGISRSMIKAAVAEATKRGFIRCVREPQSKAAGRKATTALYELNWDESGNYLKDSDRFRGFFAGDGNRTYIPNQFFDHVVVTEPLAVVKVVGAIVRFSIGFVNKWGHRRTFASLSYLNIQRYTRLTDRSSLAAAIRAGMDANYIERVEDGYFDPHGGVNSRTATYALKWLKEAAFRTIGSKTRPGKIAAEKSVQKPDRDRFENQTGDRFENQTGLQIKQNKTLKQQSVVPFEERKDASQVAAIELLEREGFDPATAHKLAETFPVEQILRQIDWIDERHVRRNRIGMLRMAIEQDWSKPTAEKLRRLNSAPEEIDKARGRLAEQFNSRSS